MPIPARGAPNPPSSPPNPTGQPSTSGGFPRRKAHAYIRRKVPTSTLDGTPPLARLGYCLETPARGGDCSGPWPAPPPPLCDIPSGCCSFMGPWTVTRSSLRMLRRVAAFCRPLRPVLLRVSFPRSRSPVVGVPGLCWMWHWCAVCASAAPNSWHIEDVLVVAGVV